MTFSIAVWKLLYADTYRYLHYGASYHLARLLLLKRALIGQGDARWSVIDLFAVVQRLEPGHRRIYSCSTS